MNIKFQQTLIYLLFFCLFSFHSLFAKSKAQPNIIFIIADQMRSDAMGVSGNKVVNTPNLDKMAKGGALFTQAFSNNPVCLPSRISMFSGQFPNETGVLVNFHHGSWLPFNNSMPWHLREVGYRLGYVGKNHAFIKSEMSLFDVVNERAREQCRSYSKFSPPNWHSDIFWPEEDCNPAKNTDDAIRFITSNHGEKPFFLTISYFDPHPPYMAPAKYSSRYCADDIVLPELIDPQLLGGRINDQQKALCYDKQTKYDIKETMRYYYAAIEWGIDTQVGRVLETLEKQGLDDNTIIVFTSDHGDFMGEFNMVRKGMFLYDALLHVPMIWYGLGHIKGGQKIVELSQCVDIYPTLLDYAKTSPPDEIVGQSLRPLLDGESKVGSEYVFAAAAYSDLPAAYWEDPEPYYQPKSDKPFHSRIEALTWQDENKTAMVRNSDWKLIVSQSRKPELYFMDGANIERENLFGNPIHEKVFQELKEEIQKQWHVDFIWE